MIVVSDTSPITNLAAIDRLDLLHLLYGEIIIPVAVYNELTQPNINSIVPGAREVQTLSWIKTQPVQNYQQVTQILTSQANIDRGEAEAIILALELNADLILIDERRGRMSASTYNLKVTGLLGILLQAKKQQAIANVKPLMDTLIQQANFRIRDELYQTILKLAGE